ncbi:hypothetical protein ACJIZ3_005081 [Penstemon smallii]|uniref:Uncharacterized protein n=1 Tax=Penstemon smallii TaxID=265156 RepID=A0ABD3S419_9LAMI
MQNAVYFFPKEVIWDILGRIKSTVDRNSVCPRLKHLTLSYCHVITDTGLSYLASCSHLCGLELISAERITGSGIYIVCGNGDYRRLVKWQKQWILPPCDTMVELNLVNCTIGPGGGLPRLIGKCKNLEKCPIRELGVDSVGSFNDMGTKALCSLKDLEKLELTRCKCLGVD